MTKSEFENIISDVYHKLPKEYSDKIDNVYITVEDYPTDDIVRGLNVVKSQLLGLYQGIPLTHRGTYYGMNPTIPDKITLFKMNIEAICKDKKDISERILEVLLHELGHYFGMSEKEIQDATINYKNNHNNIEKELYAESNFTDFI